MKITIEIPDIKYTEFMVAELLEKSNMIPSEYKDYWTEKLIFENEIYILAIQAVIDGEVKTKEFKFTEEELNDLFLKSINYFEYNGSYGSKFELTSDEEPGFHSFQKEGTLESYLKEVIKEAVTTGYSYGYCE